MNACSLGTSDIYDKHCEGLTFNVTTASKHLSNHRDVDSRRLTVAANYFTSKCKVPWRGSLHHVFRIKNHTVPAARRRVILCPQIATDYRGLYLAQFIKQNYRFKTLGRPAQESPDVARLGNREIEPIMLRLQHDGRQRRLNYRFASFIPCLFRKQPVDFAPLKVVYDGRHSLALHAILQQKVRTHGHLP